MIIIWLYYMIMMFKFLFLFYLYKCFYFYLFFSIFKLFYCCSIIVVCISIKYSGLSPGPSTYWFQSSLFLSLFELLTEKDQKYKSSVYSCLLKSVKAINIYIFHVPCKNKKYTLWKNNIMKWFANINKEHWKKSAWEKDHPVWDAFI